MRKTDPSIIEFDLNERKQTANFMDTTYIIGNWKSHKTIDETERYLWEFADLLQRVDTAHKSIVLCPSFTAIETAARFIKTNDLNVVLGAQDVSAYEEGAYTGEVHAGQLRELADYVIIAHSERKRYFGENDADIIREKVNRAKQAGLKVVLCVQNETDTVVANADILAYEPPSAIGSGEPDSVENITRVFEHLHERYPDKALLYGGSVTDDNIRQFLDIPYLNGFLIGGASLSPQKFVHLISLC